MIEKLEKLPKPWSIVCRDGIYHVTAGSKSLSGPDLEEIIDRALPIQIPRPPVFDISVSASGEERYLVTTAKSRTDCYRLGNMADTVRDKVQQWLYAYENWTKENPIIQIGKEGENYVYSD